MSKSKKIVINALKDSLPPHLYFKGLGLCEDEFMNIEELICKIFPILQKKDERIRDIANGIIKKQSIGDGIFCYDNPYPILDIIIDQNVKAAKQEFIYLHHKEYPVYRVTSESIETLLDQKNTSNELDRFMIETYKEELIYFRDCVKSGILIPSFKLPDTKNIFTISFVREEDKVVRNENISNEIKYEFTSNDSKLFVAYKANEKDNYYSLVYSYNFNKKEETIDDESFLGYHSCKSDFKENIYLHKALLPNEIYVQIKK